MSLAKQEGCSLSRREVFLVVGRRGGGDKREEGSEEFTSSASLSFYDQGLTSVADVSKFIAAAL